MPRGTTVTGLCICTLLSNHLRSEHWLLSTGVLLLHYTRPHTVCVTAETVRDISFWVSASSLQSPDFAPCEYYIYPRRLLVERLSNLMKCKRWCTSGYACSERIFLFTRNLGIREVPEDVTMHVRGLCWKWQSCIVRVHIKLAAKQILSFPFDPPKYIANKQLCITWNHSPTFLFMI